MKNQSLLYSAVLHSAVMLLVILGLPDFFRKEQPPVKVITVEVLPFSEVSNVRPKKVEKKEIKEPVEASKNVPNTSASKAPPPEPIMSPEPLKKNAEPVKPKEPVPPKEPEKKKTEKKPLKEEKKKDNTADLDSLMKTLEEASKKSEKEDKQKKEEILKEEELFPDAEEHVEGPSNPAIPLSVSEKDMIRGQVEKHWNIPSGAKSLNEMSTVLKIKLERDGTVISVEIIKSSQKFGVDSRFARVFDESVVRAVKRASPIQNLPPDRYDAWHEFEYEFTPEGVY